MIKVTTRVTQNETAAWAQVTCGKAVQSASGHWEIQFGLRESEVPNGRIVLTEYDRAEWVKALGGIWPR